MARIMFINKLCNAFFNKRVCVFITLAMLLTSICRIFLHIKHNILLTIAINLSLTSFQLSGQIHSSNKTCISHLHYLSPIHDTWNIEYLYINIIIAQYILSQEISYTCNCRGLDFRRHSRVKYSTYLIYSVLVSQQLYHYYNNNCCIGLL